MSQQRRRSIYTNITRQNLPVVQKICEQTDFRVRVRGPPAVGGRKGHAGGVGETGGKDVSCGGEGRGVPGSKFNRKEVANQRACRGWVLPGPCR